MPPPTTLTPTFHISILNGVSGVDCLILLDLKMLITLSSSKEGTDNQWTDLAIEIQKSIPIGYS